MSKAAKPANPSPGPRTGERGLSPDKGKGNVPQMPNHPQMPGMRPKGS